MSCAETWVLMLIFDAVAAGESIIIFAPRLFPDRQTPVTNLFRIAVCVLAAVACGEPEYLDVGRVLNKTEAELEAAFGKPDTWNAKDDRTNLLQWKNIDGDSTRVVLVTKDSLSCYVTYSFKGMEPFDQKKALAKVGISWPQAEPQHEWENGSKRWMPYGEYEKLVIGHREKAVTVALETPFSLSAPSKTATGPGADE